MIKTVIDEDENRMYALMDKDIGNNFDDITVRRHIVGGANRTLFSVDLPPRLCRTGT